MGFKQRWGKKFTLNLLISMLEPPHKSISPRLSHSFLGNQSFQSLKLSGFVNRLSVYRESV